MLGNEIQEIVIVWDSNSQMYTAKVIYAPGLPALHPDDQGSYTTDYAETIEEVVREAIQIALDRGIPLRDYYPVSIMFDNIDNCSDYHQPPPEDWHEQFRAVVDKYGLMIGSSAYDEGPPTDEALRDAGWLKEERLREWQEKMRPLWEAQEQREAAEPVICHVLVALHAVRLHGAYEDAYPEEPGVIMDLIPRPGYPHLRVVRIRREYDSAKRENYFSVEVETSQAETTLWLIIHDAVSQAEDVPWAVISAIYRPMVDKAIETSKEDRTAAFLLY